MLKKKIFDEEVYLLNEKQMDGWLIKFVLYDKYKHSMLDESSIPFSELPDCIYKVPILIIDDGIKYDATIETGFFGVRQDKNSYAVKPVMGFKVFCDWKVRKENKNTNETTKSKNKNNNKSSNKKKGGAVGAINDLINEYKYLEELENPQMDDDESYDYQYDDDID